VRLVTYHGDYLRGGFIAAATEPPARMVRFASEPILRISIGTEP
jgi:hypothetical protein